MTEEEAMRRLRLESLLADLTNAIPAFASSGWEIRISDEHRMALLAFVRAELDRPPREAGHADMAADRAWLEGARFGWNCGVDDNQEEYYRVTLARDRQIIEARKASREYVQKPSQEKP